MEVVSGDSWTTGDISHAKLQSNHHHQQTNIQFLLQVGCPSCHPTNSAILRNNYYLRQPFHKIPPRYYDQWFSRNPFNRYRQTQTKRDKSISLAEVTRPMAAVRAVGPCQSCLHCAPASCGAVYCNRSGLWVGLCLCVGGSVTTITRNCVHRSSPN